MNLSSMVYPYLSTPIDKSFLVSILLFCSLPIKSLCHKFFELSLLSAFFELFVVCFFPQGDTSVFLSFITITVVPGLTWQIRLRMGNSHLSISWTVVHCRCYTSHYYCFAIIFFFFCYFLWLLLVWSLFFVSIFISLDNSLSNQTFILTCLFSFWLIIKLYHLYYGSITSCYSTLYYYTMCYSGYTSTVVCMM